MDRMRGRREGDRYDGPSVLRLHGHRCRDVVRHFTGWPQAEAWRSFSNRASRTLSSEKQKYTFLSRDTRQERERSRAGRASKNVERRQTWTRT